MLRTRRGVLRWIAGLGAGVGLLSQGKPASADGPLILGATTVAYGAGEDKGIVIDETSSQKAAAIDLIPGNADRNAIIRFWPEQNTAVEDVTMQVHKLAGTSVHRHWQIHTKSGDGAGMLDRLSIDYLKDDAAVQVSNGHLQVDDGTGYIGGTRLGNPMPFRKNIDLIDSYPFLRFRQLADGLMVMIGRLGTGGPVTIRPSGGSGSAAGFRVEREDADVLMAVDDKSYSGETTFLLRTNADGQVRVQRVLLGPADGAGVGYRALRVAN